LEESKVKKYNEADKTGSVYILETDGGIKVGRTKDKVTKRVKGLGGRVARGLTGVLSA
jgi:hypothetical protein